MPATILDTGDTIMKDQALPLRILRLVSETRDKEII